MRHAPRDRVIRFSLHEGVEDFLSSLETLVTALSQRPLNEQQTERYARIINTAERDLLARARRLR